MKSQDKARPASITVKLHPEVLRQAQALGEFYDDSEVDHIISEAIKDAARSKKFIEWLDQHPNAGRSKEEIVLQPAKRERTPKAPTEMKKEQVA